MASKPTTRGILVHEDAAQGAFGTRLFKGLGVRVLRAERSGSDHQVIARIPEILKHRRAQRHQHNLISIVMIDGDNKGVDGRRREVDRIIADAGLGAWTPEDRLILLVPCRSIETWLCHLTGIPNTDEDMSFKRILERRDLLRGTARPAADRCVELYRRQEDPGLPSLRAAFEEIRKQGL